MGSCYFPYQLKYVVLGDDFEYDGNGEPRTGSGFHKSIQGVSWPSCLETLVFGNSFNKPLPGEIFPPSLLQLSIDNSFNDIGLLPRNLAQLNIGHVFIRRIGVELPSSLRQLSIGNSFDQLIKDMLSWPVSLLELKLGTGFTKEAECIS